MHYEFPKGFLWGAGAAAHQVEGNNINSDSWLMENLHPTDHVEPSLDACDHYHLYPQDIALYSKLGWNAYRFSIEWARIEPEPGYFSSAVTEHYRRMLAACKENNLTTVVTFQHITSPRWLISSGGWQDDKTPLRFAKYCSYVAKHLGDLIDVGLTINQPNLAVMFASLNKFPTVAEMPTLPWVIVAADAFGIAPDKFRPHMFASSPKDVAIQIKAHQDARDAIKSVQNKLPVGWTVLVDYFEAVAGGEELARKYNHDFIDVFLEASKNDDIVGLQVYSKFRVDHNGVMKLPPDAELTEAYDSEYYPECLEGAIRYTRSKINTPILVTENGVAASDDTKRVAWIRRSLTGLKNCLEDGIDVRGYLHWSAMDNFEWMEGYRPKFGLIAVNRETQERTVKESARFLGEISKANSFDF